MPVAIQTAPNEETPLLKSRKISEPDSDVTLVEPLNQGSRTPSIKSKASVSLDSEAAKKISLPWAQFSIVLILQLAEPLTSQVIYPFAPELVRSLGVTKNDAEVGHYVGIIESLFYTAEACTVLHWSRLSDHIGRKPVILSGLFGLSLSMYCFALSKTFWGLVFSRVMSGALNGNIGVMKSVIAEIFTDEKSLAVAYSYEPLAWSTGVTVAPIIGGVLSRPVERFPSLFGNNKFLEEYPYFLPCAVPATFSVVTWLVTFFFLKETHPSPKPVREFLCGGRQRINSEEEPLLAAGAEPEQPLPLRELLTRDVLVASANHAFLALVDIFFRALQPIFLSTSIELGGLGLDPPLIGTAISFFGILNGVATVFLFKRLTDCFGMKGVYMMGITANVPCFCLFPVITYLARSSVERSGGLGTEVWIAAGLQMAMSVLVSLCYGVVFIYIAASAPNKASLGATNGFAQLSVSVVRAIGPAVASSVYSLSIDKEHHYMNGWLVYYVSVALSFGAIWAGSLLPKYISRDKE